MEENDVGHLAPSSEHTGRLYPAGSSNKEAFVKYIVSTVLIVALATLANGAVAFLFRYNFITQERYGPSLVPVYIIGAGIFLGIVGLTLNTKLPRL